MSKLELNVDAAGRGVVALDGHDIAPAVRSLTLTCRGGDVTYVELDVMVWETSAAVDARVVVPDATHDVLVRLGWTPPDACPAADGGTPQ